MNQEQFDYTKMGSGIPAQSPAPPAAGTSPTPPRPPRRTPVMLIGCLLFILFASLIVGAMGGIVYLVMESIKSSDIYATAVDRALSHPEVQAKLGPPITPGWYVMGNISTSGNDEEANLSLPLEGMIQSGTLYVEGHKRAGQVHYVSLAVVLDGTGERIELLSEEVPSAQP